MKSLTAGLISRLKLEDAVVAEAEAAQSWMPLEPAWQHLKNCAKDVAKFLTADLKSGHTCCPGLVANMRKPSNAIRPLAVWNPFDRVIYRALTTLICVELADLDQSAPAYRKFIESPVEEAKRTASTSSFGWVPGTSEVKYIVKSDITAFYQYIDHSRLVTQLQLFSNEFEAIDALIELISEVEGRRYGLPQMLDSSDRLADVYIQAVERGLTRVGRLAWRFNDDFRMTADSYSDALLAVEQLAVLARDHGLVMSEYKTTTPTLLHYLSNDSYEEESDGGDGQVSFEPGVSPEEFLTDYAQAVSSDDDPTDAIAVILRTTTDRRPALAPTPNPEIDELLGDLPTGVEDIYLRDHNVDDGRRIRRSLNKLARLSDATVLDRVAPIVDYMPSLTPNVVRYLAAVPDTTGSVGVVVDQIITTIALNTWQQTWLLHLIASRAEKGEQATASQMVWIAELLVSADEVVAAQAHLSGAKAAVEGLVTLRSASLAMRRAPQAVHQWYLEAARVADPDDKKGIQALAGESRLGKFILS